MKYRLLFLSAAMLYVCAACSPSGEAVIASVPSGAKAALVQTPGGSWGVRVAGNGLQTLLQPKPVRLEFYIPEEQPRVMDMPYSSVVRSKGGYLATAEISAGYGVYFSVNDLWTKTEGGVSVSREVKVKGRFEGAGFATSFNLLADEGVEWRDVLFFAPGLLYGDSSFDGPTSPGGTRYDQAHVFTFREDFLPAPMYGMRFSDGQTVTILDAAPDATTTLAETQTGLQGDILVGETLAVGSFSSDDEQGAIRLGFTFPSTTALFPRQMRGFGPGMPAGGPGAQFGGANGGQRPDSKGLVWCRRYNCVNDGFCQYYRLDLRFARDESFPQFTTNSYRWAWSVLKPELFWHDIEIVRTSLADQLSGLVNSFGDRTGLPYQVKTKSGEVWERPGDPAFYWRAPLGFVGKHIESAVQLIYEGDRDKTERGAKMRRQGLAMVATAIKYIPTDKPVCGGVNLLDGSYSSTNPPVWYIRELTDDMIRLLECYEREKAKGIDHTDWLKWCKDFADWAITLQREDGSLPRSFMIGDDKVREESGTTSYNVVATFVKLSDLLGDDRYLESAIRAADFVWESYGQRGIFIGGAIDNPNITDKEAGLLSCEAFMSLYEKTKDEKWLERAKTAADFAETWTWIWNVPMPEDAPDDQLNWAKGVPTVGIQGITAQVAGHTDKFLDMSIVSYAKLYKYTGDEHYFDFARILMHNCKAMLALPGRLYGLYAPGYQTENFRMGADRQGRGFGTPEKWMPWVTTNHLFGINSMEAYDKELFDALCAK